jgi:hypothetical protein
MEDTMIQEKDTPTTATTKTFTIAAKDGTARIEDEQKAVKAFVEAKVKAAYDKAMNRPSPEVAEPYQWWNLYAYGPVQALAPNGPLSPQQIIKVGEDAYITTVIVLNPSPILPPAPGISPLELLTNFSLPYEVQYQTGNLTTWTLGPAAANVVHNSNLIPHLGIYVDVLHFVATQPGLMEMNISTRILGNPPQVSAPHFAGFARYVYDFDPELFWSSPTPGYQFDMPVKFLVYP